MAFPKKLTSCAYTDDEWKALCFLRGYTKLVPAPGDKTVRFPEVRYLSEEDESEGGDALVKVLRAEVDKGRAGKFGDWSALNEILFELSDLFGGSADARWQPRMVQIRFRKAGRAAEPAKDARIIQHMNEGASRKAAAETFHIDERELGRKWQRAVRRGEVSKKKNSKNRSR